MQPTLRRAGVEDAAVLAQVGAETFVETFGAMYPPQDLEEFLATTYNEAAARTTLSDPDSAAWLVEVNGRAVGHALAGPCGLPHPEVRSGDGELKRLYLLRQFQNGGLGRRLFEQVLQWLERDGPRTLWIGVWSENFGAQRFYARYGFERVGAYDFVVGDTRDHEFILRRSAGQSLPPRTRGTPEWPGGPDRERSQK